MSQNYEKLKILLQELFQLDQPDLDFGLYRVMHAKSAEGSQFLEKDLLPQVQAAFGQYKTADKTEIEKELAKVIAGIEAAGVDPAQSPKVNDLRARLKSDAVDVGALESEVYDHLFSFFRRYYSEGDFLAKRVYKPGVYAIPYEGEEVRLHWANKDQYYIKTSEYLRDYCFRLAAPGESGRDPSASSGQSFIAEEDGERGKELVIRFEYRPATLADWPDDARAGKSKPPAQKDLSALAARRVLAVADASLAPWIAELGKPHVTASGDKADYTRMEAHLKRYTARNTFDYFIHKDLGGFLRRELDFYIKNEVMHLDDVENETAPRVEQYLSKVKVIRRIAGKIIDFLAQLEDFQKKLRLKKKFVVETQWCIKVGCIPEAFYPEIAANEAQRGEWVKLFAIDEIQGDLMKPGYSKPLKPEFLKTHPTLVVDTRHFEAGFASRLLEAIGDVDEQIDGVLFHSENFQAIHLIQNRYREQARCIYIDPPYNTGQDSFVYRDSYQHSSWLAMVVARLGMGEELLDSQGAMFVSIDNNEAARVSVAIASELRRSHHSTNIIWQKVDSPNDNKVALTPDHEYVLCLSIDPLLPQFRPMVDPSILEAYRKNKETGVLYRDRLLKKNGANSRRIDRPTMYFPLRDPDGNDVYPVHDDGEEACWALGKPTVEKLQAAGELVWKRRTVAGVERWEPYTRETAPDVPTRPYPTIWLDVKTMRQTKSQLRALFGTSAIVETVKPTQLIERILAMSGSTAGFALDYFAGSGTTGHAVINLNREDGGRRKFILVEMGDYFDTVLLPRIKKVTFTPEWKDGKPKRLATPEEAERSPRIVKVVRLESYEDALNNLESRRTDTQQLLLAAADAQGADGLKEQYLLRYMLNVETRGSQSLLNVQAFTDPTAYKLKVKRPGSDESREVNVDLLETFNWLIGLTVQHIAAPQVFSAAFERDSEKRLRGGLKPVASVQFSMFGVQEEGQLKTESLKTENSF